MLKSKVFLKKTKRGGVLKIVREHYLRDDIYCGHPSCSQCYSTKDQDAMEVDDPTSPTSDHLKKGFSMLSASTNMSVNFNGKNVHHILIPDTNVVIHQVCCVLLHIQIQALKTN